MKRSTLTLILSLMAIAGIARAQAPSHFTVHHRVQFAPGTERDRQLLKAIPDAQGFVEGSFEIAREDLNDDGRKEVILVATDALSCGSHGCSTVVLEDRGGTATETGSFIASTNLAVTNEKLGSYRARAESLRRPPELRRGPDLRRGRHGLPREPGRSLSPGSDPHRHRALHQQDGPHPHPRVRPELRRHPG